MSAPIQHNERIINSDATGRDELSESAKWRKQEEDWARAEEARFLNKKQMATDDVTNTSSYRKGGLTETYDDATSSSASASPIRTTAHPNAVSDRMGAERFGKLRDFYNNGAADAKEGSRQYNEVGQLQDGQKRPYIGAGKEDAAILAGKQQRQMYRDPAVLAVGSPEFVGSPKGIGRVSRKQRVASPMMDGHAPYSTNDVTTTVAGTIRSNHHYDDRIIVEHDSRMEQAGSQYNSVAKQVGVQSRYVPGTDDARPTNYGSPTAYLDNEAIRDEKLYEQELKERIEQKNREMMASADEGRARDEEYRRAHGIPRDGADAGGEAVFRGRAFDDMHADGAEVARRAQQEYDPKAPAENFVAFHKPRSYNNAALKELQEQRERQKGLHLRGSKKKDRSVADDGANAKPKFSKAAGALMREQLNMTRPTPADAIQLGAQGYEGLPPRSLPRVTEDTPDMWFERFRRDTIERRAQKETTRRRDLERQRVEAGNSLGYRIKRAFKDTKASGKSSVKEYTLRDQDMHMKDGMIRARERVAKYFPDRANERVVCAFDCQALHNYIPMDGHLILTTDSLMYVGRAVEVVEAARDPKEICYDKEAPKAAKKRKHVLVAEAIPLGNILSMTRGAVVKNNAKTFVLDIVDPLMHADALQFFAKDGINYQFLKITHPCVNEAGESYDGRSVLAVDRFINFFDHTWRAMGGDAQQVEYRDF